MATNESWGIEIGASAIKAMHLVGDKKTGLTVAGYEVLPFKQVLTDPDAHAQDAIKVNLDLLLSRHDLTGVPVVLSVPGNMAFARIAKLPPVDPKKIPDIVRFEAAQQIPFPIEQVEWDYQVFAQEDSPDVEVGIFAITKDRVMQFLSNVKGVKIQPDALTLSPLAVYNALHHDMDLGQSPGGVILMDIGTTSTDVVIVESGRIWLRTLPLGGNNFTEALMRAFNLSFPKAEKLKREASTSKYARQIFQAMRPVFADLVGEMQRSIGYYQSLNRDAKLEKLVGLGSTFRLPGLTKFLKQQLQIEITRPDSFKKLSIEGRLEADFAQNALNLATAYGLALQGLGMERIGANILPSYLIKQRVWKSKQPYLAAAAAVIVAATGLAVANYVWTRSAWESAQQQHRPQIEAILATAQGHSTALKEVRGQDRRAKIENVRRILDYRDVWPKLMHDINNALLAAEPQPELLSTDYTKMLEIPRPERRQIKIESITAEYNFVWDEAAAEQRSAPVGMNLEEIWRRRAPGATPGAAPGAPSGPGFGPRGPSRFRGGELVELDEETKSQTQRASKKPPSFFITLVGTTPHRDAANLINANFLKWLQEQPDAATRPYTIIVDSESIGRIELVAEDDGTRSTTGTEPAAAPGPRRSGMAPRPGMLAGGGDTPAGVEASPLVPPRPGANESRMRDTRFVINFTIQLKPPVEARQAFWAEPAPPAAPQRTPPTDPPTASPAAQRTLLIPSPTDEQEDRS